MKILGVFNIFRKKPTQDSLQKLLKQAQKNGDISDSQNSMAAKWALVQIYNIQNNSKLINAIKTYNTLK